MRIPSVVWILWNIVHLLQLLNVSASFDDSFGSLFYHQSLDFEYQRPFDEIERHCSKIISSRSKLVMTDAKAKRIKKELTFYNGDWKQENDGLVPLMPFDASAMLLSTGSSNSLKLVNFEVMNVTSLEDLQNGVRVGGIMSIGITRSESFSYNLGTMFFMSPDMSVLTITFEGVYVETREISGERLLCLLGNTTLPSRRKFFDWQNADWYWKPDNQCPGLMQNDQLLLVLKYPKMSKLTANAIQGEMRSLNERKDFKFFDKVQISSQLGWFSAYQFSSSQSNSCNTSAHQEELMKDGANLLSGSDFCKIFKEISNEVLNILPDHHANYNQRDSRELDPFVLRNEVFSFDESYKNVKLMIGNVKCQKSRTHGKTVNAKVFAVFRVVPVHVNRFTASSRTGLSGMTLRAEGMWDSSTGTLCMVGSVPEGMEAKISMYFPQALSVQQRSIVFGSIEGLFTPLHFNVILSPSHLELRYGWYASSFLTYNYTKMKQADEFRKRNVSITKNLQQSLLRYPAIQEVEGFFTLSQIYDLTGELYIDTEVAYVPGTSIKLQLLSIGPYLARYDFLYKARNEGILADANTLLNDNGLLNVSLHLTVFEEPLASAGTSHKSVTHMFLEGLYDPRAGMMYLIGCAKAGMGSYIERGLDCLIEVTVQYSPNNLQWLRDQPIKIRIMNLRNTDDPLYFHPMEIESKTIVDISKMDEHKGNVAFRKIIEGMLRVTILLIDIAIIWSQKIYMDRNSGLASFASLNLFATQSISYIILLVDGKEILLSSKETIFNQAYLPYQPVLKGLDAAEKLVAFIALLLSARLFCKVSEARVRLNNEEPSNTPLTSGDWPYFLSLIRRFTFAYIIFLPLSLLSPLKEEHNVTEILQIQLFGMLIVIGRYWLNLPLGAAIIENWRTKNNQKSLRKIYYIGLPLLRIMLKSFDHIRSPTSDPYIVGDSEAVNMNLLCINILVLIIQVIIVHVQQNFNYLWLIDCLKVSRLLNLLKLKQLLFNTRTQ